MKVDGTIGNDVYVKDLVNYLKVAAMEQWERDRAMLYRENKYSPSEAQGQRRNQGSSPRRNQKSSRARKHYMSSLETILYHGRDNCIPKFCSALPSVIFKPVPPFSVTWLV